MTESFQAALARRTIETYIRENKTIDAPEDTPAEMKGRAGVFVSIKKRGALRGCIGTFVPTTENIATEIIKNAIAASTQDPRFPPVEEAELPDLEVSVDVLSGPEKADSIKDLDAQKYGVIVACGRRKGLLLPCLEGVNTPEDQIAICKRKAGIGDNEIIELQRFEVKRYF